MTAAPAAPRRRRFGLRWISSIIATCAAVALFAPDPARAHASLESSTPAASTVLEESPPLISLNFDEDISIALTSIQLFDSSSESIDLGPASAGADASIVEALVPALVDGSYAVIWRISSADGHVVTGAFSFQLGTASTTDSDELLNNVVDRVRSEPSVGRALGVARFTAFVGVAMLFGGLFMVMMVNSSAEIDWPARRLLWIGWALLLVGSFANFGLLAANAAADGIGDALDTSLWSDLAGTRTGGLLVARLALLMAMLGVLLTVTHRRHLLWWGAVPMLGILTVFTFSGGGHPSVQSRPIVWMGVDAVHLALIAVWLGSLAMMAAGGRVWLRDDSHSVAARSFSKMATVGVPLIVATGVLQTWRLSGGFDTLTDTTWGRILLAKGTVVVLVVTIGAVSRWLLVSDGPSALRRTVLTETMVGVAVLGLAAGMVGVPPDSGPRSRVLTASLAEGGVIVEVAVTPGQVGQNQVHVVVVPPGGSLVPIAALSGTMNLGSRDIPAAPVALVAESPNHYSGTVTLAFGGDWTLELVVSPEPAQSILLSSTVPIP